jgi:hypothetical protein
MSIAIEFKLPPGDRSIPWDRDVDLDDDNGSGDAEGEYDAGIQSDDNADAFSDDKEQAFQKDVDLERFNDLSRRLPSRNASTKDQTISCKSEPDQDGTEEIESEPEPYKKRSNPMSGIDNCASGGTKAVFSFTNMGAIGTLLASPAVVSDIISAKAELQNAQEECNQLEREKSESKDGKDEFTRNYQEISLIRRDLKNGKISLTKQVRAQLEFVKTRNRALADQAIKYIRADTSTSSAKLTLIEKWIRGVRDFCFGPAGVGVTAAKAGDLIQTGAVAKILDLGSKAGSTALGIGAAIGGAVVSAAIGALHLLQSLPEMKRSWKRLDEQRTLCGRLDSIDNDAMSRITSEAQSTKDPVSPDVVDEVTRTLTHVTDRCKVENRKLLSSAKAEFAKSVIRCIFGTGSIILGILGFFFPPVALAGVLFGVIYAVYVGIHVLVTKRIATARAEALAAEEKEFGANPDGFGQQSLSENSAWQVARISDYLQGRTHNAEGKFRSSAVKRLLLRMGMDNIVVKALQARAEAIDAIGDEAAKTKAVDGLRKEVRHYLFEGGIMPK